MKFKIKYMALTIIGIGAFLGLNELNMKDFDTHPNVTVEEQYEIKVNENGQTYGSNLSTTEYGHEPDLILVESDDGKAGYVYKYDFYDTYNQPRNPEEALKLQEKNLSKYGDYKEIPVYNEDGEIVIDTFRVWNR